MDELITRLHQGGYSCVIANHGEVRMFTRRGVADLHTLLHDAPDFLQGAVIADKVVGKGAAALMVAGRIRQLHTDIISEAAFALLGSTDIEVSYDTLVPFIWNRTHTGPCPVEQLCATVPTAEACLPLIDAFIRQQTHSINS